MNFGAIRICLLFLPPFPHLPLAVALPGFTFMSKVNSSMTVLLLTW